MNSLFDGCMDVVFNVGLNVSLEFWTIYHFDVSGPGKPILYIGFIHEFITIYTEGTSASSIADFLDDLHSIIDVAGDEIDSLIDIRS